MTCPHCGAEVPAGNRFCNRCRKRVAPEAGPAAGPPAAGSLPPRRPPTTSRPAARPTSAASSFKRPAVITILGVLDIIGGVFALAAGAFFAFGGLVDPKQGGAIMAVIGAVYALIGVVQLAAGVGLLGLKPWGRPLQIGLAVIGLLGIPCGTIISILILIYMLKPEVKLLFSGASPRDLAPEELAMVQRLGEGSGATVAIVAVLVVVVAVFSVGIIAAIAIPSLLRARVSANESATIGDLRTMVSAQAAYASANRGFHDQPQCLLRPVDCIPGYPGTAPTFLDPMSFSADLRHGYRFRFVPGPEAPPEVKQQGEVSPSSLTGFAYVAEPAQPGQTGVRAFCAEASGVICFDADGRLGGASDGTCPADCTPLQ
jgi:type II secretory pathway pseudopilin PulG